MTIFFSIFDVDVLDAEPKQPGSPMYINIHATSTTNSPRYFDYVRGNHIGLYSRQCDWLDTAHALVTEGVSPMTRLKNRCSDVLQLGESIRAMPADDRQRLIEEAVATIRQRDDWRTVVDVLNSLS